MAGFQVSTYGRFWVSTEGLVSWPVESIGVQEGVNLLLESGPERVIARAHGIIRRVVLFKERDHDTGHPNAPRPIVQVDL